jgi:hypothetical protein
MLTVNVKRVLRTIVVLALLIGSFVLTGSFVVLRARAAEPPEEIQKLQQWVYEQGNELLFKPLLA